MKKKYKHEEENLQKNVLGEPAIQYGKQQETEMTFSPPLTEEELRDALTTEQVQEHLHNLINKLYDQ